MRKYTILVDFDDTLTDLLSSWISKVNELYSTRVIPKNVTDWNIELFFPTLTRRQVFEPIFDDNFWNEVRPKPDASKYLKKLIDDGHQVYICTNTNYKTLKSKMDKVLFRYFDYLTWNDVIITRNKQMINADILIDDGIHNLVGGRYKGILVDAPHNRNFNEKEHDIIRVKTWEEIYEIINNLAKEQING